MFDWDANNISHIGRHNVTPEEAEQALSIFPVDVTRQYQEGEERFLQIGATSGLRVLVVVTTWRGDLLRVVRAYNAPTALQKFYWEERKEFDGN
ncbi:BrnT family toxin [Granulicella sp. dw_53]|uniref:BrnT family toxin n=1 Tax=Granulicella sp. dw_53 TaxID=2719792 RepID=UPI001BD3EA7E